MEWNHIRGCSGVSYYSGRIGDPGCLWIHEDGGRYHVARGVSFENLDDAKAWFMLDAASESCDK